MKVGALDWALFSLYHTHFFLKLSSCKNVSLLLDWPKQKSAAATGI
jgi:hypothetical protein